MGFLVSPAVEVVEIDLLRAWQAERLRLFQKRVKPIRMQAAH
jgi:hypothetical protein